MKLLVFVVLEYGIFDLRELIEISLVAFDNANEAFPFEFIDLAEAAAFNIALARQAGEEGDSAEGLVLLQDLDDGAGIIKEFDFSVVDDVEGVVDGVGLVDDFLVRGESDGLELVGALSEGEVGEVVAEEGGRLEELMPHLEEELVLELLVQLLDDLDDEFVLPAIFGAELEVVPDLVLELLADLLAPHVGVEGAELPAVDARLFSLVRDGQPNVVDGVAEDEDRRDREDDLQQQFLLGHLAELAHFRHIRQAQSREAQRVHVDLQLARLLQLQLGHPRVFRVQEPNVAPHASSQVHQKQDEEQNLIEIVDFI